MRVAVRPVSNIVMALCAITALLGASLRHAQAACAQPATDEDRIAAVIDARTIAFEDGREIRLSGIAPLPSDDAQNLSSLIKGQTARIVAESDTPDRYGRQRALIFVGAMTQPLQIGLLERGEAMFWPDLADRSCSNDMRAAERKARQTKLGVWSGKTALKSAESPGDILALIGRFSVVQGTVSSARQAGGTFYINFGRRWTEAFAVTISRRAMTSFEGAGIDVKTLAGKRVIVRGFVERTGTNGGPRIELTSPEQIDIVELAPSKTVDASGSAD